MGQHLTLNFIAEVVGVATLIVMLCDSLHHKHHTDNFLHSDSNTDAVTSAKLFVLMQVTVIRVGAG